MLPRASLVETTFPAASSHTFGIESFKLKYNNVEKYLSYASSVCLLGEMNQHLQLQAGTIAAQGTIVPDNFVFIDFDPRGDDNYLLETSNASSLKLVANMGVDEASYISVLELVQT